MSQKQLIKARAQIVRFAHTVAELLAAQHPERPHPCRLRRRLWSRSVVYWRQGDSLVELVAGFYSTEPVILRISGNCGLFRASQNLLRQLAFFPRCPVCFRRCPKVWNGTEMVCARSGHESRASSWRPDLATRFELSCLTDELVNMAPLSVAITSGAPMGELVRIPCARLLQPCYLTAPNMSYTWTAAANALSEESRARREALRNERNKHRDIP